MRSRVRWIRRPADDDAAAHLSVFGSIGEHVVVSVVVEDGGFASECPKALP